MKMITGLQHLSYKDRLKAGVVQLEKRRLWENRITFQYLKGAARETWRRTFYKGEWL